MTHRKRIVASSLLLLLSALVLFGIYGYVNMNKIRNEAEYYRQSHLLSQLEYNAMSVLKQANAFSAHIKSEEYTAYSSEFLGLGTSAEGQEAMWELNDKISRLYMKPELIQSLYILGEDSKQLNYARAFDQPSPLAEELPWIEDLNGTGIMEALTAKGIGFPVYIQEGELQRQMRRKWTYVSDLQLQRASEFVHALEGKWIINNGINDYTLSLMVLGDDFPREFLMEDEEEDSRHLSIYTDQGIGTWGASLVPLDFSGQPDLPDGQTSWTRMSGDKGQVHYIKKLAPYGVVLVWTEGKAGWSGGFSRTIATIGAAFVLLLSGSLILSMMLAKSILSPLHKLSRFIRSQGGALPLSTYSWRRSSDKQADKLLAATSIRTKLVLLFLATVLVPLLTMVVLYSALQNHYARQEWKRTAEALSGQMGWTVSKQAEVFEGAAHALAANDMLSAYLTLPSGSFQAASGAAANGRSGAIYPESEEFAYFILYDMNGSARYSTIFSNNLSLFYLEPQGEGEESPAIAWLPEAPDVYNHLAGQLIKQIYRGGRDERGTPLGYLQLVLKPDAFQAVERLGGAAFRIEDGQGQLMFQSQGYEERDLLSGHAPASAGRDISLVLTENVPKFDWSVTVKFSFDAWHDRNRELLWVVASVALLCFLVALTLSRWLVRPIGLLQEAMERINEHRVPLAAGSGARDEVSLLAQHYNRMVEKINQLVEEDYRSKLREKELNELKTQAEMSMLQQQINPHFLYNTLESINMEAQRNNGEAVNKMIGSLAKLFRYSIRSGPEQGVPLETEIEYTKYYITVQENRFKDRFAVKWDIDPASLSFAVLKLILQPIVENAINHGLSEYASGGELSISSRLEEGRLVIAIADNGTGMRVPELERLRERLKLKPEDGQRPTGASVQRGIGLGNVYRRLKIYYGDQADVRVESRFMRGTTVTLIIPGADEGSESK
ncbi:sensor histidine kinase [Cohnella fermenti]|nr:sensor histidine kinase [Cohnella fermenti]